MSDDNTIAQVAAGTAPQSHQKVESNYDDLQADTEAALDSGLEDDLQDGDETPEDQIDEAQKKGDITKAQAQQLKKTLKIKVDGQEMDETIDFSDDESLKKYLQKAKAFDKRSNEYAQTKQQMDQLLKMLQEDPEGLMERLGHDVDDLAEKRLTKKVEQLKKSPEQIQREKELAELEQLRKEKQEAEDEKKRLLAEQLKNEESAKIEAEISAALDEVGSILPKKDPEVIHEIARTMFMAMKQGVDGVTAKDVIPFVEEKWQKTLHRFFDSSSEEVMEKLVKKENLDRYRKKQVAANKASKVGATQTTTAKQLVKDSGVQKQVITEDKKPTKKFKSFFTYGDD